MAQVQAQEEMEKAAQKPAVLAAKGRPRSCSSSSSSSSSRCCDKKKALFTVFELDKRFVKLVNEQNLSALYKLIQPKARYAMVTPRADTPGCERIVGPLSQFLPNYIGYQLTSIFQDITYNADRSVTIHVLDVLTQGTSSLIVEDVWRTYTSHKGCNYKIDYLNGVNWVCK